MKKDTIVKALLSSKLTAFIVPMLVWAKRKVNLYENSFRYGGRLKRCKYVHLMANDKFNKPFVDFLNSHFDPREHLVLCKRKLNHPFPEGENVIEVRSYRGLNFNLPNIRQVICHSLFDEETIDILYENQKVLTQKAWWIIYSSDLYCAPSDERNDFVRSNIKGWLTLTDGDGAFAREKYGKIPMIVHADYTYPITMAMINDARKDRTSNESVLHIQINNACDKSTLEMLDVLAQYREHGIKVTTILSYGDVEYRDEILKKGKGIFGDNFIPVSNYLSPSEYARHMATTDVLVININRQRGIGNSFLALAMGVKLFIRSDVSTYSHFNGKGIKVYDTLTIKDMPYAEFSMKDEKIIENNRKLTEPFFDGKELAQVWGNIFKLAQ